MATRPVILCGGLQSSGSTLVSWCFLQRRDTDGVLDANGDIVINPPTPAELADGTDYLWFKTTISGFALHEQIACAQAAGFHVRPLLVVRDVRGVWASLAQKAYGSNGTTAEDPPLRVRLSRFLADWQMFVDHGWPILRYESLVAEPEATLRQTCQALDMPWDEAMLNWPKGPEQIARAQGGNVTFASEADEGLMGSLRPERVNRLNGPIPADDLAWMETTFAAFNQANDYPSHREAPETDHTRAVPRYDATRRFRWRLKQKPLRRLLHRLGLRPAPPEPGQPDRGR